MRANRYKQVHPARRVIMFVVSVVTLILALVVTIGAVAASGRVMASYSPGKLGGPAPVPGGQKGHATCDLPGQPKCPAESENWVPVASLAPQDVLAAMQKSTGYMSPVQATASPTTDTFGFDAPVEVKPATSGNADYRDNLPHLFVRASINGVRRVTYELLYDPAHHQLRIMSIGFNLTNDPHYGKPFPWEGVSVATAVAAVQSTHGVGIAQGSAPELVYFAPNVPLLRSANFQWTGGGTDPAQPIWRIHGNDGHLYFVGVDGHVYTPTHLPAEKGAVVVSA